MNFVAVLQETKLSELKPEHKKILKHEKLNYIITPSNNSSGGLISVFPENLNIIKIKDCRDCQALLYESENILIINSYINPKDHHLTEFIKFFDSINPDVYKKTFLLGDLNAINPIDLNSFSLKVKLHDSRIQRFKKLAKLFNQLSFFDLARNTTPILPTHFDKRTKKWSRIDYIYCDQINSKQILDLHRTSFSDHQLLYTYELVEDDYGLSLWKLNDAILSKKEIILETLKLHYENCQSDDPLQSYEKFKARMRASLRHLCIREINERSAKEQEILEKMTKIEEKILENRSISLFNNYENLNSELRSLRFEQSKRQVKAIKGFYLDLNEGNPKSVKSITSSMRLSSKIQKIKTEEGITIMDQAEILNEFHKWYQKNSVDPELSESDRNRLIIDQESFLETHLPFSEQSSVEDQEITEYEVRKAIQKLNKYSAPGPDGLTSSLYKSFSDFFAPLLVELFNNMNDKGIFPESFRLAIIKLIPKKSKSLEIGEFRPISLINTDQKILSHILANRIKSSVNTIIDSHQTAHLPNRSIHSGLLKIRKMAFEVTNRDCLLTIDFSKAFDRIYRSFFMNIVKRLGICSHTKKLIELMYEKSTSLIEIDGFISPPVNVTRGVRQGCPLSALLFIVGLEPLLRQINTHNEIESAHCQKIVAYADDLTACIRIDSLPAFFDIFEQFHRISGLEINPTKTEIASIGKLPTTISPATEIKILGVPIWPANSKCPKLNEELKTISSKASKYALPSMSYKARSLNIETFVISKLSHRLRHLRQRKGLVKKLSQDLINQFWLMKKHHVNNEILQTSIEKCGLRFKNLAHLVIACKIMNLKDFFFQEPSRIHDEFFKSRFYELEKKDIESRGTRLLNLNEQNLSINQGGKCLELTKETKTREIYDFLQNSVNQIKAIERLQERSKNLQINSDNLLTFVKGIWSLNNIHASQKNIIYNFLMGSYLDKEQKWLKDLVPHPLCFQCCDAFESFNHLMFECPVNRPLRNLLQIRNWKFFFNKKSTLKMKFLASTIICSWTEEPINSTIFSRQLNK